MVTIKIYIEGGGSHNKKLDVGCRRGFRRFFEKAGIAGGAFKPIPCGSRSSAFRSFRIANARNTADEIPILLVDSEGPVTTTTGWQHVKNRQGDNWDKPLNATDSQLHLMVQCMETWFLADREMLTAFYGQGFAPKALPNRADVEEVPKDDVFRSLERATRKTKTKGRYSKGSHSFELLARLDPTKVRRASIHADQLLKFLETKYV